MTAHGILWIYIVLLIGGGIMGLVKGGSKISLITAVAFAIPLILCEFDIIRFHYALWILIVLLAVFAWRFSQSKKFMPGGLLLVLTLAALIGLWSQSRWHWPWDAARAGAGDRDVAGRKVGVPFYHEPERFGPEIV